MSFYRVLNIAYFINDVSTALIHSMCASRQQKEFLDSLKKALTSTKTLSESAAVSSVKLCKAASYMRPEDNSVLCFLVLTILNELKVNVKKTE
jgi:neurofibromin 1